MSGRSMNLMDLLSNDSNGLEPEQEFNNFNSMNSYTLYDIPNDPPATTQQDSNPLNVYYLPTELSAIQKDMFEAVVQMFASTLPEELFPKRERSNINSLLLGPEDAVYGNHDSDKYNRAKKVALIYNQLLTICMHPSLVVDHFISKGLLLLSTKSRLSSLSGKLLLFDKIVDLISEKYDVSEPPQDYNLLVVGKSIKELELIEGLVIGKKLRYRNVTNGKSLYEEERRPKGPEKDELPEDDQTTEYKHRHNHFAARRARKGKVVAKEFVLHLITSNHLCLSFTSETPFDLIISFDSELDVSSPGIELLRSSRKASFSAITTLQAQIPILIPLPVFSVEHLLKVITKPESELGNFSRDSEADWHRRILGVYVANRHHIFEESPEGILSASYGKGLTGLTDLIFDWNNVSSNSSQKWLGKYTSGLNTSPSSDEVKKRLDRNFLSELLRIFDSEANGWDNASQIKLEDVDISDYESLKKQLARFLNARIAQIETLKTEVLVNIIPELREKESRRQEEIDNDEEQVGENYRKLRKLNEEVISVEKRFNRVENENQKLQESVTETQQMLDHLQDILENKSTSEIDKIVEEQAALLEDLEKEKKVLSEESKTLGDEIEVSREEYQAKSTKALQVTENLQALKDKQDQLHKKAEGPGMLILPSLARKDEMGTYESHLRRVTQENAFLNELFTLRFDKLVKERNLMVDTAAPTPGNRQTHRISRAATPLQNRTSMNHN